MYISEIELINFKSHTEKTFRFTSGTNAIIGLNGAGKSSIIEAIGWVLFDYTGSYTLADFVRHGEKRASIGIKVQTADQKLYTIRREIRVNKNKTANSEKHQVFNENNDRLTTDQDVKDFIKRDILQVDSGVDLKLLFSSAVGVPQGTFTSDFLLTPANREKIFGKVLKVEEYKESADELGKVNKFFEKKITDVQIKIGIAEGKIPDLETAKGDHKSALKNEKTLVKELENLEKEIGSQKKKLGEFESLKLKVEEKKKIIEFLEEIAELAPQIDQYKKLKARDKVLQTELTASREAKKQLDKLDEHLKELRENFRKSKENIESLEKQDKEFSQNIASETANLNVANSNIETIEARQEEVTQQIAHLQATIEKDQQFEREVKNGMCPILSQRCLNLGEDETLETYFKGSFASNSTRIGELTEEQSKLKKFLSLVREADKNKTNLETAKQLHSQITKSGKRLKDDEELYIKNSAHLPELETENAELEKQLRELGNPIEREAVLKEQLSKQKDEFLQVDFNNLPKVIEKTKKEFDKIFSNYKPDEHEDLEIKYNENRESKIRKDEQFITVGRKIEELLAKIEELEKVKEKLEEDKLEETRLKKVRDTSIFIKSKLKEAAPQIAKFLIARISYESNLLFREITGNAERTLNWREDYEISLEELGYDRPFATLSGGEQMAAAMSVRLALLKEISDVRFAFFDEPTVNMDEENRERLAESIREILKHNQKFDQIFVISHDDTFENYVNNPVQIGEKASQ